VPLPDLLASQVWTALRYLSPFVLLWLAFFFGRTLRPSSTPLIERLRGAAALTCRHPCAATHGG
jgi:hypothetical protein